MLRANAIVPDARTESRVLLIPGQNVMFDSDLVELYGVKTKRWNEQGGWPTVSGSLVGGRTL